MSFDPNLNQFSINSWVPWIWSQIRITYRPILRFSLPRVVLIMSSWGTYFFPRKTGTTFFFSRRTGTTFFFWRRSGTTFSFFEGLEPLFFAKEWNHFFLSSKDWNHFFLFAKEWNHFFLFVKDCCRLLYEIFYYSYWF